MAVSMWWARLREWLPRGNTLSPEAFDARHRILRVILLLHVPPMFAWGLLLGYGVVHSALEVTVPAFCWAISSTKKNTNVHMRRMSAFFVTAGLVWCSAVLVHLSGGTIEAHFHFFIVIPFITLYQDWPPFLWAIGFTVVSHGLGSVLRPDLMFNHEAAVERPWTWAAIHGVAVAFASAGGVTFWQAAEREHDRSMRLVEELAASEKAAHKTFSDLLVNLARRSQQLVERQLTLIDTLEQEEHDEVVLGNLYQLDHYATRMRRNAESLIVVSGSEMSKLSRTPQPLSEVIRGAIGEVEDYQRVDVAISADPLVAGRAVSGLTHLLAELVENATNYSPSSSRVTVLGPRSGGRCEITVVDQGIGMADEELAAANGRLAEPLAVDADLVRTLGLHVVGRLAQRLGVTVQLAANAQEGLTATVVVPEELISRPDGYDPFGRDDAEPGSHPERDVRDVRDVRDEGPDRWSRAPRPPAAGPGPRTRAPVPAGTNGAVASHATPRSRPPGADRPRVADHDHRPNGSNGATGFDRTGGFTGARDPYAVPRTAPPDRPATDRPMRREPPVRPPAPSAGTGAPTPRPAPDVRNGDPGALPRRRANGATVRQPQPQPGSSNGHRAGAPPAPPRRTDAVGPMEGSLAHRVPMSNLDPNLVDEERPEPGLPSNLAGLSSFQSGLRRARTENDEQDR